MVQHMTATMLPHLITSDESGTDTWHDQCRSCHTLDTGGERYCSECIWD